MIVRLKNGIDMSLTIESSGKELLKSETVPAGTKVKLVNNILSAMVLLYVFIKFYFKNLDMNEPAF